MHVTVAEKQYPDLQLLRSCVSKDSWSSCRSEIVVEMTSVHKAIH